MNYIIEENIDFYKEINMDEDSDIENDKCLITNEELLDDYVTLECNHRFNYKSIYNDIHNHKKKYNNMEKYHLRPKQIRCPYCRNIQNTLLPLHECYPKVHGVNYFNPNIEKTFEELYRPKNKYINGICQYDYANDENEKDNHDNSDINIVCGDSYVKYLSLDKKFYCFYHGKKMRNKLKKKQLDMEKNIIIDLTNDIENVIVEMNEINEINEINITNNTCCAILKTGINKGKMCNIKKIYKNGLCKRHYCLQSKSLV